MNCAGLPYTGHIDPVTIYKRGLCEGNIDCDIQRTKYVSEFLISSFGKINTFKLYIKVYKKAR